MRCKIISIRTNLLIVGGAGYIGMRFVESLCDSNFEKINVASRNPINKYFPDNSVEKTSQTDSLKKLTTRVTLNDYPGNSQITNLLNVDLLHSRQDLDELKRIISKDHPVIINFAGIPNVHNSNIKDILATVFVNSILLRLKTKMQRMIFISSTEVYGKSKNGKVLTEEDSLTGLPIKKDFLSKISETVEKSVDEYITGESGMVAFDKVAKMLKVIINSKNEKRWLYGVLKRISEISTLKFENTAVLRLSNVFGGDDLALQKVISIFLRNAMTSGEINLTGNGKQKRSFIHIDDVIKAILHFSQRSHTGVFNITNQENNKEIIQLAYLMKKHINPNLKINTTQNSDSEERWDFSADRAVSVGFKADISLEEYLKNYFLKYFQEHLQTKS